MFVTLDRIKKHLNIDEYYKEDDWYLLSLYDVAEHIVGKHTDSDLEKIAEANGGELPPPLVHAMLLFIGDMYVHRETNTSDNINTVPFAYDYILSLFKNYSLVNNSK